MKVLLDENLDHRLRRNLGSHEVFTASYKGWEGLKNGRLLDAAENDKFEVLITGDQSLYFEQNLIGRRLAIIALSSVEWRILKDYLPKIAVGSRKRNSRLFPGSRLRHIQSEKTPEK